MERGDRNLHQQRRNPCSSSFTNSRSYGSHDISSWKPTRRSRNNDAPEEKAEGKEQGAAKDVSFIIGTCPYMCPERERAQRERRRDLAVFERLHGNPDKSSVHLAIKKASDVRPLPVLEETLKYLLKFLDSKEHPFEVAHDFIFDRTRSIRQDLSMQNIANDRAIYMYEEMVKFHIISHHKLQCCSNSSISSMRHLNMEQLGKALTSLYNLYDANRESNYIYENEAEFRSLYVLLHLDTGSQPMGVSLALWFRYLSSVLVKSKEICFARRVLRFFRMGNYKAFLCTTASEASFLQYCILEPYINEIRALALSCINNVCYKLHPYPVSQLSKLLIMKESDVESFGNVCGLEISTDIAGMKVLPTKQTTFSQPKGGCESYVLVGGLERFEREFAA